MAYYKHGKWIIDSTPPCEYKIGEVISINGCKPKMIADVSPVHSVSGPVGCLLRKDEVLPDKWFNFYGQYIIYFKKKDYIYEHQISNTDQEIHRRDRNLNQILNHMLKYNITRREKAGMKHKYLDSYKKRWLSMKTKLPLACLSEKEADEFIQKHKDDEKYYYFKTIKVQ